MDHVDQPPTPTRSAQLDQISPEIIVSVVIGILVLALGFLASRMDPDRALVPLISSADRFYYIAALVVTGAAGVASGIIRSSDVPSNGAAPRWVSPSTVLPAISVAGASLLFAYTTDWGIILLTTAGTGGTTWLAMWVESQITPGQPTSLRDAPAPSIHLAVTVAVGLLIMSTVYGFRMNMRYTAPLVFLATGLLIVQALATSSRPRRYVPITLVGALLLTELAWVLAYWNVAAWHGGAILGLGLYTFLAIVGGQLSGATNGRDLVRQALISAPVLAILILAAR